MPDINGLEIAIKTKENKNTFHIYYAKKLCQIKN